MIRYLVTRGLHTSAIIRTATSTATAGAGAGDSGTAQAERTLRRFWKSVHLTQTQTGGEWVVKLDARPLKTPGGRVIAIPHRRRLLASLVALEWSEQTRVLKPHALPLTSLAARAIDACEDPTQRTQITHTLLKYLDTDTILFHEDQPASLVRLQSAHWDPLIAWLNAKYSVPLAPFTGLLGTRLPPGVADTFAARLAHLDPFELAAFERAVLATKSFLIPLALLAGHLDVEAAAQAAEVEVQSQIDRWGHVEDSHDVDHADLRRILGSVACAAHAD